MMDYNEIFRALYEAQVKYLLCGGLAVNIYGIPRMTADIDFLLELERHNISRFQAVMEKFDYSPSLPLNLLDLASEEKRSYYLTHRNLIAYSFVSLQQRYMTVDVLLDNPQQFDEMWQKREVRKLSGYEMYLTCLEDLIAMKKHANREQDISDVLLLSQLRNQ